MSAMSSSTSSTRTATNTRRTNSLAFAKSDCHTCSELSRWCDRQRPQCGTCTKHRRKCGGYVLDLTWKGPSHHEGESPVCSIYKNEDLEFISPDHRCDSAAIATSARKFKFKQGRSRKKRAIKVLNNKKANIIEGLNPRSDATEQLVDDPAVISAGAFNTWFQMEQSRGSSHSSSIASDLRSTHQRALINDYTEMLEVQDWSGDQSRTTSDESLWAHVRQETRSVTRYIPVPQLPGSESPCHYLNIGDGTDTTSSSISLSSEEQHGNDLVVYCAIGTSENNSSQLHDTGSPLPQGILYNDSHHKFGSLMEMYDREFCIIPLTVDGTANPFRVSQEGPQKSQFLLHAILALSMQHIAKKSNDETLAAEMLVHQSTATHLYSEALSRSNVLTLLDTLLILLNLDATQSASGTWDVHLMGALKLLEGTGGVEVCQISPRTRAQVAMLVWWDVTIAFIQRQEPLFPVGYLETLLQCDANDGWTFFSLNGCPGEFVHAMARLAKLASIYEKVTALNCEWTTFNPFPIDEIVENIKNWKNKDDSSCSNIEEHEDINAKRDRFHCSEAWRHAIILYSVRVFTKRQTQQGVQSARFLARMILDHIRCIRNTEIIQKQVLIPLFLAAAEVGEDTDRTFVRQYCTHWSMKSRYFMFETAEMIIERIWLGWREQTRDTYWWGLIVNGGSMSEGRQDHPMANQLLFG